MPRRHKDAKNFETAFEATWRLCTLVAKKKQGIHLSTI
jgi:hypothetical protein